MKTIFILIVLIASLSFYGQDEIFMGYTMNEFSFKGHEAKIVVPHERNRNGNWIWRARFWGHEPQVDKVLLEKGFHLAYIDVADLYGNQEAVERWNDFYRFCIDEYKLNPKVVLEGMSRGGLIIYNWASENTEKVLCIYADAPVCDIKSWPGGLFKGKGSPEDWEKCLKEYDLDLESVMDFQGIPIYTCAKVAESNIPVLHVCGDSDTVVPYEENTALLVRNFEQAGGKIELIIKKGVGHHPHSLEDPKPIVDFILTHACGNKGSLSGETIGSDPRDRMLARADSLELETDYAAPPGDPQSHHASGFAKILCSAVFVTGLDFDFAAENIGYFTAPYHERAILTNRRLDLENKAVHITLPNGVVRTARYFGDQGCICLPEGKDELNFTPVEITKNVPDPETTPWPMGDLIADDGIPDELDQKKVSQAVDAAFADPEALTAAFIITYKGQIIGERYRTGITKDTPLESWSMGKSLTATLMGILIKEGEYELFQPAPIPEWQEPGDPRARIRIADIMRMSSGLSFRAPQDPDFDPDIGYPDHIYVYTSSFNSFKWSATRPQQWAPNTVGRYRNCDPSLINYLIRLAVERRGEEYLSFPQRVLFDKIGIGNMVMETDTYGNLLLQGYEFGTARDWARLGNLYLNDGVWMGQRILPEGFVEFVSTVAPAWEADGRPIYGGFFWINGTERFPVPKDVYFMAGAGGQYTIIIPSHHLVVVKLSHYKGSGPGGTALGNALKLLMEAVPESGSIK